VPAADDPLTLVHDAIATVAAGEVVDLELLRARLGKIGGLIHPGFQPGDGPPGVNGLDRRDVLAPLFVVLSTLEIDGPVAAEEQLFAFTGAARS
jgi:hypothetical protein